MTKQFTYSFLLIGLAILVYVSGYIPNICDTFFDLNNCNGSDYTNIFSGLFLFLGILYSFFTLNEKTNFSPVAKWQFFCSVLILLLNQYTITVLNPDRASIEFLTIISLLIYVVISIFLIIYSFATILKKN
jgi:hypothetical protein